MYRVHFTIVVDHPEKRGASFTPVPAGTRSPQVWEYKTQVDAVGVFQQILRGEWDFASEYVSRVSVHAETPHATGCSFRTVRREVRRVRPLRVVVFDRRDEYIRKIQPTATGCPCLMVLDNR